MGTQSSTGKDDNGHRPARNRRDKRSTFLGELTDDLRLSLRADIYGRLLVKVAAANMGVSLDTLKSFLTTVYVNCPRKEFLRAVVACDFASEPTRRAAKAILARTTGEYSAEFLAPAGPSSRL